MNDFDKLIDRNFPYKSTWSIVDIDNMFVYDNYKYYISNAVSQYAVSNIPKENKAKMDRILIVEQNGKIMFFDQNLNKVKNFNVKMVL